MKWFRRTLSENRIFILTLLAVQFFYLVDGRNYVHAHQVYEQKEARLKEISELLDIPVEKLRPDHETLFDSLKGLFVEEREPVREAGLKRLQEVLKKHEEELAANPYLPRIEAVKREHAAYRIEGIVNDLMQLTEPPGSKALPEESQRALLRNLHYALQDDLTLPVPEGLPAKAQAKLAAVQAKLDRWFESVRPIVAETQSPDMTGTLAQKIGQLRLTQSVETKRSVREPRFVDRPLPLRRVEKKARAQEVSSVAAMKSSQLSPAISPNRSSPRAPTKDGIAPEILELAAELGNSPARIFRFVHDSIELDPKWGAFRGSLGTLWERKGTSWDQAWLLRDLLVAAGVDARFEWGEIEISPELLTNVTGLDDPFRAGDLLTTAGVPIVLLVQGSRVIKARMSHVWVKAYVDYIPNRGVTPGAGDTWIRMDPSLKLHDYADGIRIHDQVPFSLGSYLLTGTALSPRRAHEEALWAYIRANGIECTTLEQLKKAGSIVEEGFPFLPGTLRGSVLSVDGEAFEMPAGFQERMRLEVRAAGGGSLVSWEAPLPALFGQRIDLVYAGATADDQAVLDSHGGVFETPPYLVDLKPVVKAGGVVQASGGAIGSAEDVEVFVTLTPVNGAPDVLVHDGFAGEPSVLATDFGRLPAQLLDRYQGAFLAAQAAGDEPEIELARLQLIGAVYMHDLGRDLEDLAGWNWHRVVRLLSEGLIAQNGSVTATVGGEPLTFTRAETFVDIAGMILGLFHTEGDTSLLRPTLELAGAQASFLEGEVFNQVVEEEGIAAVSALTRAQREGQVLALADASNVETVLAAIDLGGAVEDEIRSAVADGKIAWVPEAPIGVNQWQGSGYILEDPTNGAAAYLISGGFAGGAGTGPLAGDQDDLGDESWLSDWPLPAFEKAVFGEDADPQTNHGDPVNLSTGNLWFTETDLTITARGLPIIWSRTYNSRSAYSGPLGHGWTFSYGEHLEPLPDGSLLLREADGSEHRFGADGAGGFVSPPGKYLTLTADPSGGFELRDKHGLVSVFSAEGKLLSRTDRNGNTVTLAYDGAGDLASVTDAAGRTALTVTNQGGRIVRVEDFTGRAIQYAYDGDDLVGWTDTLSHAWTYGYDAEHNLIARGDPLGNTDTYAYDSLDRCTGWVDALGNEERYAYLSRGERAVVTDPRGHSRYLEFDARGRATLRVDPLGNATRSTWGDDNNRTSTTDPRGGVTTWTYDDRGNVLETRDALGNTTALTYEPQFNQVLTDTDRDGHTTTREYDANGNLVRTTQTVSGATLVSERAYDQFGNLAAVKDPNNNTTTITWSSSKGVATGYTDATGQTKTLTSNELGQFTSFDDGEGGHLLEWDAMDRLVSVTDRFDNARTIVYDAAGRRVQIASPHGDVMIAVDALGRPIAITDALGNTRRAEYDATGNVIAEIDALGNRTVRSYDALGREIATVDALGNVWSFGYCAAFGGVSVADVGPCETVDPLGNRWRQDYDETGRVVRETDPLGDTTEFEYDASGRKTAITDPLGRTTRYEYDELGRRTAIVEANGARTEHIFDGNGNLIGTTDAEGRDWTKTYDALGHLLSESDPLGNTTTYAYDALGNRVSQLTPEGELITYQYDGDRLVAVNRPDGVTESFGYDVRGRRISMTTDEISVRYLYDDRDRVVEMIDETLGENLGYTYDQAGRRTRMTTSRGTVDYLFDALGRLVEQRDPASGTYRFAYDALGRRTRMVLPNGMVTEYAYDAAGRTESVLTRDAQGAVVDGYGYSYDAVGNRTSMEALHGGASHTYAYDEVHRLTRWQRGSDRFEEYGYDLVGNRTTLADEGGTVAYEYDLANRLLGELREFTAGGSLATAYSWDDNGNLLSKQVGSTTTTYAYDPLNRLTAVDGPGGVYSYGYDGDGIRVRETGPEGVRRFLHDQEDIVGVFDSTGARTVYYSHGPGFDEPLAQTTSDGTHYLHRDALGSVTALSTASGQLSGTVSYAAFGGVEATSGTASVYGFTSRELDPTGLMYYRARYYQPQAGRFLTEDSFAGFADIPSSLHQYVYVRNNPITRADPLGLTDLALAVFSFLLFVLTFTELVLSIIFPVYRVAHIIGAFLAYAALLIAIELHINGEISWKDMLIEFALLILAIIAAVHVHSFILWAIFYIAALLLLTKSALHHREVFSDEYEHAKHRLRDKYYGLKRWVIDNT